MYRKDRVNKKGGGVLLYVHKSLKSIPCEEMELSDFSDSVWCIIQIDTETKILVGTVYRSPSSDMSNNEKLLKLFEEAHRVARKSRSHSLIMGDFNLPEIDYKTCTVSAGEDSFAWRFYNLAHDIYLTQKVTEPTRFMTGQQPSKLDYIFVDDDNLVDEIEYLPPIGASDHLGLLCKIRYKTPDPTSSTTVKRAYWRGDYASMAEHLVDIDWQAELSGKSVQEIWNFIRDKYNEAVEKFVPVVGSKRKMKSNFMSSETLKLIKERNRLFGIYKKTNLTTDYTRYKEVRNRVVSMIRHDKEKLTQELVSNFKQNPKAFYGFVRSKQSVKPRAVQVRKSDRSLTQSETETANELLKFFQSVFVQEDKDPIPSFNQRTDKTLTVGEISQADVSKKLSQLLVNKSPGPDGLHPKVLKEMSGILDLPLTILFNKSLKEGELPDDWTTADVIAIFKKGSKLEAGNYRPVSLTSIPCKVLESIVRDRLLKHLEGNSLLSAEQHGFRCNRSCLTNLLETFEEWTRALDEGFGIDAIFLDYQKAFDTVPHNRLLTRDNQTSRDRSQT